MKYSDIVRIYKATDALANKPFTNQQQWSIYKLRKALKVNIDFYSERESAINNKYLEFVDEEGLLKGEKYQEYLAEKDELSNTDAEFDYEKLSLPLVDGIDFKTMESLEDIIEFIPE